jgi:hypothetical protein
MRASIEQAEQKLAAMREAIDTSAHVEDRVAEQLPKPCGEAPMLSDRVRGGPKKNATS